MKSRNYFVRFSVVLGFVLWVVMAVTYGGVSLAAEVQLVNISSVAEGGVPNALKLAPQDIKIKKDGVVVWINGAATVPLQVVFEDGKTCKDLVSNPAESFNLNEQACFVTTFMPFAATSSLVFPAAGKFEYKVISDDGKLKTKGSIDVK